MRLMIVAAVFLAVSPDGAGADRKVPATIPATRTVSASETYFGTAYKDPYRWLENLASPEVTTWFKAQAAVTDQVMSTIPGRDKLVAEWMKVDSLRPMTITAFSYRGGRLFYLKRLATEDRSKLYMRPRWTGPEQLVFDPSTYKPHVNTTVTQLSVSFDGKHVALALAADGAEWAELRVVDVDTHALLPERIFPSYMPMGWTPDSKAFFYDAGSTTDITSTQIRLDRQIRAHTLGTEIGRDRDVLGTRRHPELGIVSREIPYVTVDAHNPDLIVGSAFTTQSEQHTFVASSAGLTTSPNGAISWRKLVDLDDKITSQLVIDRGSVYGLTYVGAPRYKLVRTSLARPDWKHAETIVPEASDSLDSMTRSKDFLFLTYSTGVTTRLVRLDLATGRTTQLPQPLQGVASVTCPEASTNHCIVAIDSWTRPTTKYELDGTTGAFTKSAFSSDTTIPGMNQVVVEEVEVTSHDGVKVPLSILHNKDQPLDGSASAILEGYGAYGASLPAAFTALHTLVGHGVVIAYAHVRGGGEKGDAWYKGGLKATKRNSWLDFIATAHYLIDHHYTRADKLAGLGTSAGGIVISRAVTARPDLFAAAVVNVGIANAMRMEFSAVGPANIPELGSVTNRSEIDALYDMDGLAHVAANTRYPATMSVAGWNDPRVPPWQLGKFAAALQATSSSARPQLLKVNYDNGHFTEDRLVTFRNFADQYSFMLWQTGHPEFQPR